VSEIRRRLLIDGNKIHVAMQGDAEELAKQLHEARGRPQRGEMRHKWSLDTVMVNKFYSDYCGHGAPRPMDAEFWAYVDKKMESPEYAVFRADDPANAYRLGWGK
jgi:hypothetical protein